MTQTYSEKKIPVLPTGVEPKTFPLLVRMLYHWAQVSKFLYFHILNKHKEQELGREECGGVKNENPCVNSIYTPDLLLNKTISAFKLQETRGS